MKQVTYILLGLSISLYACTSKKATTSTKSPADVVAEVKKNYTADQMEEGKTLWQSSCQKCHKLYEADSRTVAKWESVLPRMSKRAKLSDDNAGKVRAYLIANAKL